METGRKTTIPVKPAGIIDSILKNATSTQLDYMNSLAKSVDFPILGKIMSNFRDLNAYAVFNCVAKSAEDLEFYRMYRKGQVDGLFNFFKACQLAGEEIKRRRGNKDGS